jgi:hypothetical protein
MLRSHLSYRPVFIRYSVRVVLRIQSGHNRGSLMMVVCHQGERLRFSLGVHHLYPHHWDTRRERVHLSHPDSSSINKMIDEWVSKIILYYTTLVSTGQPPSISGLQSHLFPNRRTTTRAKSPDSVVMWFNRFIREHTNKGITQLSLYPSS